MNGDQAQTLHELIGALTLSLLTLNKWQGLHKGSNTKYSSLGMPDLHGISLASAA